MPVRDRRLSSDVKTCGVFWLVSTDDDGRYVREAQQSLDSVIKNLPGVKTNLFLDGETKEDTGRWDRVWQLPKTEHEYWYLRSTRWFVWAVSQLHTLDRILYLDSDTYVCSHALCLYDLLDNYEFAIAQSPQRDCCPTALECPPPESFCAVENGVNIFRNNERIKQFLAHWLDRYEAHPEEYEDNDNGPLRDELWENPLGIKWVTLAPEFGLRFDFGAWIVGRVRVLHGRNGGVSTDKERLSLVGNAINDRLSMRMWRHGALIKSADIFGTGA